MTDKHGEPIENQDGKMVKTAAQTAVVMAIFTLGSKGLGFIRELTMAGFFGTSYIVDAYVMSQSIPSILFGGVFGAIATSYMPLFSEKMAKYGPKEGNLFTSKVLVILFFASGVSALVGILFSNQLTHIFARGFTGETAELTAGFLKVTFIYVMFSSTAGILEAYMQYKNIFIPQIIIGYVPNVVIIITIIISAYIGYQYLAFGLLIGNFLRFMLIARFSKRHDFDFLFENHDLREPIKQIAVLALPVFIGSSTLQINLFVDKYLASELQEGSVAALNYANTLNLMILGITVTIITTMIYPRLTKAAAEADEKQFSLLIQQGISLIIIIALPFALGAIAYHEQIVQIIFERGAFDPAATALTGSAYMFYSLGMVFYAVKELLVRMYYAKYDMKTPVICSIVAVAFNITFNLVFVDELGHNGLALATSIANFANMTALIAMMKTRCTGIVLLESKSKLIKIIVAAVMSVLVSLVVYYGLITIVWMPRIAYLVISVLVAMAIYLGFMKVFKIEELEFVKKILGR